MSHDPPLPEVFRAYFAELPEHRVPGGDRQPFHHCFGCGPAHASGLRVRCFVRPPGVVSPIVVPARYAGPPGAAHGGIVAAYLDEVMAGAALHASGRVCVTGELTVRYLRPTPVETPLLGRGRLVGEAGRWLELEGSLETFPEGTVVATGRARFVPIARN